MFQTDVYLVSFCTLPVDLLGFVSSFSVYVGNSQDS